MIDKRYPRVELAAHGEHTIRILPFPAPDAPRAVIQVLHGMGEHARRYARFAEAAAARGFAVVAHDHRGHGPQPVVRNYLAATNGWEQLVADTLAVHEWAKNEHPGAPQVLLGHSMGSFVAQHFAMLHGARLDALLLSGSNWPVRLQLWAGHLLALFECRRLGERQASPLLDRIGIDAFNRRFEPARTPLDWLSRDEQEVDRYIADPLCGGPYTAGLWRDLTRGLLAISTDDAVNRVPTDLPILITGGSDDPVGGDKRLGLLALHYAQTGHNRLSVKLYPGARHELLNETNRDDVTRDWLDWMERALRL